MARNVHSRLERLKRMRHHVTPLTGTIVVELLDTELDSNGDVTHPPGWIEVTLTTTTPGFGPGTP